MTCDEYLAVYSEHLDGRLDASASERCRLHAARCADCTRYDRVMRGGLAVVRSFEDIAPSIGFSERLGRRLWAEHAQPEGRSLLAAAGVSLAVAGAIAFAAWSPLLRPAGRSGSNVADVAATHSQPRLAATPIGEPGPWWAGAALPHSLLGQDQPGLSDLSVTFPGPYSPLRIEPPLMERPAFVRFVSQQD